MQTCTGHSVEYPVLLEKLFDIGVNSNMWRLLKSWYDGGSCKMRMDGMLSENFQVERGVKQGSVLSPALFLLVMDSFLRQLQASGVGLTVDKFYAGGFLHADDVRALATSEESLQCQVALVRKPCIGIGVFQCDVSPLSSRAVLESCVMLILLFGCENWILTETLW